MSDSPHIQEVTTANFDSSVIDESFHRPVLVDFWADWCAPCKMLMPVLASLAEEFGGKFLLAKLNTDEHPDLAKRYGIRSLPTVALFREGKAIDQFMGALPASTVREFLEKHIPRESDRLVAEARELAQQGQLEAARSLIELAKSQDPESSRVMLAEADLEAASGNWDGTEEILNRLPARDASDHEAERLRALVPFGRALVGSPGVEALKARLNAQREDSEARYLLGAHQALEGDYENALEQFFALLERDRAYGDDAGRKAMLAVFALLGNNELTSRYRGRMFNLLH